MCMKQILDSIFKFDIKAENNTRSTEKIENGFAVVGDGNVVNVSSSKSDKVKSQTNPSHEGVEQFASDTEVLFDTTSGKIICPTCFYNDGCRIPLAINLEEDIGFTRFDCGKNYKHHFSSHYKVKEILKKNNCAYSLNTEKMTMPDNITSDDELGKEWEP